MESKTDTIGINGKVAIVTGAGQGIGRVFAKSLAAHGAKIVVAEVNEQKGRSVADEIVASKGEAIFVRTDVGDYASVENMASVAQQHYGNVHILVNNAAIFSSLAMQSLDKIPIEEWNRVIHVNVTGTYYCARALHPVMKKNGWGRIINMGSRAVSLGRANYLHYLTSKAATGAMVHAMAREFGEFGITVNSILPGATFTEVARTTVSPEQKVQIIAQQCVKRPETPEDLAGTLLFLCSPLSDFVTGQQITVDGGM